MRGSSSTDSSYWQNAKNIIALKRCGTSGCTPDTDRITQTTTYNPGVKSSRLDTKYIYSPNARNFTDWSYRFQAVCLGEVCDRDVKARPATSQRLILNDYGSRKGKRLTLALALGVYSPKTGSWMYDASKTRDCMGSTKSGDNRFWYKWSKA